MNVYFPSHHFIQSLACISCSRLPSLIRVWSHSICHLCRWVYSPVFGINISPLLALALYPRFMFFTCSFLSQQSFMTSLKIKTTRCELLILRSSHSHPPAFLNHVYFSRHHLVKTLFVKIIIKAALDRQMYCHLRKRPLVDIP